ncbi:MAG: NAD-dependent deacylase [Thermoplasmata archaeon]|nr:NAD-dependent deacylase [Thermoplasmata archaeon]
MGFEPKLIATLQQATRIVIVTGSGISAESGIPTFRGEDGLWKKYRAEELATPEAFYSNPELVWEWYDWRRQLIGKAEPNPGHDVIAMMEGEYPEFLLITQNVDGLHRKAGSRNVVEIHGNIWRARCTGGCETSYLEENPITQLPPKCNCGAMLRPDIVWFGESLPIEGLLRAEKAIQECDVLIVIGTSGYVYPVASFPMIAQAAGAMVVEINIERTPISQIADFTLLGKAGDVLPALWNEVVQKG